MNRHKTSVYKAEAEWASTAEPSIVPSVVTEELQHTEELWENEFCGWMKFELKLRQRGQVMSLLLMNDL